MSKKVSYFGWGDNWYRIQVSTGLCQEAVSVIFLMHDNLNCKEISLSKTTFKIITSLSLWIHYSNWFVLKYCVLIIFVSEFYNQISLIGLQGLTLKFVAEPSICFSVSIWVGAKVFDSNININTCSRTTSIIQLTQATDSGNCVKFAEILGGDGRPYSIYTNRNCKDLFGSVCEGIF